MTHTMNIVIQANDKTTATHLCRAFETDPRLRITSVVRTAEQVYAEVMRQRPAVLLLTLGVQPQATWALCQQIRQAAPETAVICAAQQASPDLILDTLRNGAREFLRLPVRPEELRTVLDRLLETHTTNAPVTPAATKRGRVMAVFSPKGGCGTSFIAANMAVALNAPTVLLDLNLQASSLDLYFGVKPRFSWVDLIENRARLDEQMLASLLVPVNERLWLLAAPAKAEDAEVVTPDQLHEAVAALRARFDYVLLDVMHSFDALTLGALDAADDILLVLGPDLAAVRAAQRALMKFQQLNYPREKIRLALNRWNKESELDLREIERALGQSVMSLISDDYRTVVASLNLGQPLLAAPNAGPLGAELQRLIEACGLPYVGQLNHSKRGLMDVLLRRTTASMPAAAAPPQKTTQPLTPPAPQRTAPLPAPPSQRLPAERPNTVPLEKPEPLKTF